METRECLDTLGQAAPSILGCDRCYGQGSGKYFQTIKHNGKKLIIPFLDGQLFRLNLKGQLSVGERCVEADSTKVKHVS